MREPLTAGSSETVNRPDVALSPDAVAEVRFEIKGHRSKAKEKQRLLSDLHLTTCPGARPLPGPDLASTQSAGEGGFGRRRVM
jgi:hypothetical protein